MAAPSHAEVPGLFVYRTAVHFDEMDALLMLYHARYFHLLERAQQALFDHVMGAASFDPVAFPDLRQVVRNLDIRYLEPVDRVGPLAIVLRVEQLRASGMRVGFAFRSEDGQRLHARGTRTVCRITPQGHPVVWTEAFREGFGRWEGLANDVVL